MKKIFHVGRKFRIPQSKEFKEDTFTVTDARPWMGEYYLGAICDGEEEIVISINSSQVEWLDD